MQIVNGASETIENYFHDSGEKKCNLVLAKEKWSNTMLGWAARKNSPYTEALNIGYENIISCIFNCKLIKYLKTFSVC